MLTDKTICLQSSCLRNRSSDLDKSHLYDDFVPNYSHRINGESHGIIHDTVDNGSVGGISLDTGRHRRRHFESHPAYRCQDAYNENKFNGTRLNVDSHVQNCRSNASPSPKRRDLTNYIQQHPPSSSSSLPEQNQSHTTAQLEMSRFVQSSVSGCLEASYERRLRRLQSLFEEQNKALESQSRKLGQLHCQIERFETATHSRRISEDGPDYIFSAYLGNATEEREKQNSCSSKRNEEMEANERLPMTQEAKCPETATLSAKDEDRTLTAMGPQISRVSEPVHELNEVDELKREFHRLVAIGDSQNRQLLDISDEIAKHDELILEKRLLCQHLEEQLQKNSGHEEIYEQNHSRGQRPDFTDSTGEQLESDFESEVPQNKTRADRNRPISLKKPFFTLETLLDSDTGLSSLGSESPAELSPI